MSNMHRILWIDSEIRSNKYPNARKLSEEFEISERQAQRDIEYLRNSLGAPLIYDARQYGYSYEDKTYVLPQIYMTEEQRKVLGFLAYKYENYQTSSRVVKVTKLLKLLSKEEKVNDEL